MNTVDKDPKTLTTEALKRIWHYYDEIMMRNALTDAERSRWHAIEDELIARNAL